MGVERSSEHADGMQRRVGRTTAVYEGWAEFVSISGGRGGLWETDGDAHTCCVLDPSVSSAAPTCDAKGVRF